MKRRGLGVLLVLALIVAGGTLGQNLRFNTALTNERAATLALESRVAMLDRMVTELRAAQAGYVATGQDPEYWMAQVGTLAGRIENDLTGLVADMVEDDIRGHYEAALLALADFNSIDDRTRNYVGDRQLFLASDLIFMDALDANRRVSAAIGEALARERQAAGASEARIGWIRFAMNATALALLLVVALVSIRLASHEAAAEAADVGETTEPAAMPQAPAVQLDPESEASPPVVVKDTGVSRSSLDETAALCADIARLMDGRDLPAIVERTGKLLDARGVVLWAADVSGGLLQPALTHGYSDRVVRKLGSLAVDADNVTSLAFRTLRPQSMNGSKEDAPGAVAIPLITTNGCVGVLSAETRSRRPGAETMALARIVAAQFSTVVQPVASQAEPARKGAEG